MGWTGSVATSEQTRTTPAIPLWSDPVLRFATAHAVLILVLLASGAAGIGEWGTGSVVILSMGVVAAGIPILLRAALGVVAWAFFTGFVVNALGQLTLRSDDLGRMGAFVLGVV